MRPLATVLPLGADAARAAASLDTAQLACDVLPERDFSRIKSTAVGTVAVLLIDGEDDPSLATAAKAASMLRANGAERVLLVAAPGTRYPERIAQLTRTFVLRPMGLGHAEAVRCWLEPLAIFGLVGVDREEVLTMMPVGGYGLVQRLDEHTQPAPDAITALLTCRLRPTAHLNEIDEAIERVHKLARGARLVVTGPEVDDDGPAALVSFNF